jgi:hypothetical protein
MELMWLAARSPRKRWARRVRALRKRGSQTRANAEGAGLQKGRAIHSERGLNARGVCSRVVVVNVAEVDRRRRTQRSVRSRISPDLRSVRGRGSRPQPASGRESAARRLRAKGRRGPGRSGNPSRDRTRDWFRLAQERGRLLSIEGTSDCSGWPHLHGAAGWRSLGDPNKPRSCESAATVNGEATGVSEARLVRECVEEARHATTQAARRSGSGVVKRQVPQSPGSGCKPTAQGRSESFEEMLGADEARVLVVEAVGSRSRSVRIGVDLRGASQGKP